VAETDVRLVVQVGAFADTTKAREARLKLEKAGLKTYTQVVDTKDGQRTRVRVGPFSNRAEAEKAATKIKSLGLPVTILTL
jgi:DedD protein